MKSDETAKKMTRAQLRRHLERAKGNRDVGWDVDIDLGVRADQLLVQLRHGEISAQEAADRWTEAQRAWPTTVWYADLGLPLVRWRRRIEPVVIPLFRRRRRIKPIVIVAGR